MDKASRRLHLYELTEKLVAAEQPLSVSEMGLDMVLEISGASSGFCLFRPAKGQALELSSSRNIDNYEDNIDQWHSFCSRDDINEVGTAGWIESGSFASFFGEILPAEYKRAFAIPLRNDHEAFGLIFILWREEKIDMEAETNKDLDFVANRISVSYRAAMRYQEALGLAYIDSLSDLYNARYLPIILGKRLGEAKTEGTPLSLLFLDMDNFREVNNVHGHQAGGKALVEVGWILERHVRARDTVIRYGGDEFTVILPTANSESAREIAERIRIAIRDHIFLRRDGKSVHLTASIGVATYPDDAATPEILLHLADQAMYRGKETTRDAVYLAASCETA